MALIEDMITSSNSIQAYDTDYVTINERLYRGSLILSASEIISPWDVQAVDDLNETCFDQIFTMQPDVVLLGTGEKQIFPRVEIMGLFAQKSVGLEVMNTGALCRTFNILVAEDRNVVAAILQ